jgi:hypothetical protein
MRQEAGAFLRGIIPTFTPLAEKAETAVIVPIRP